MKYYKLLQYYKSLECQYVYVFVRFVRLPKTKRTPRTICLPFLRFVLFVRFLYVFYEFSPCAFQKAHVFFEKNDMCSCIVGTVLHDSILKVFHLFHVRFERFPPFPRTICTFSMFSKSYAKYVLHARLARFPRLVRFIRFSSNIRKRTTFCLFWEKLVRVVRFGQNVQILEKKHVTKFIVTWLSFYWAQTYLTYDLYILNVQILANISTFCTFVYVLHV